MTKEELHQILYSALTKKRAQELATLAGEGKVPVSALLGFSFLKESPALAFRSAWVLEHVEVYFPECFLPYLPEFISRLPEQQNPSCQRHFTKILMHLTSPKAPEKYKKAFGDIKKQESIAALVFDWLINPSTPVAVKVNCLDILFNFSHTFAWIKEELQAQTEFYLQQGSPAMLARGRKILRQIAKV